MLILVLQNYQNFKHRDVNFWRIIFCSLAVQFTLKSFISIKTIIMKHNFKIGLLGLAFLVGFSACNQNKPVSEQQDTLALNHFRVEALEESNDFPTAKLELSNVKTEAVGADSVKVTFDYNVANYELTKQTADMNAEHCANSAEGQHIHFILDNKPYQALYKPTNTITLAKNSEHYLLSFLSRSYHLSVKSPDASVLVKFKIDENGKYVKLDDPKEPLLFYSRPKGEYKGKDTEHVLLDFYVKNAVIAADAYKVKVSVADTTFTVDRWTPYFIKGAAEGPLDIKIELLDKDNNTVNGPFNPTERTVTILP
jgi:hypothetical protein